MKLHSSFLRAKHEEVLPIPTFVVRPSKNSWGRFWSDMARVLICHITRDPAYVWTKAWEEIVML
jgi:hypothetical protein